MTIELSLSDGIITIFWSASKLSNALLLYFLDKLLKKLPWLLFMLSLESEIIISMNDASPSDRFSFTSLYIYIYIYIYIFFLLAWWTTDSILKSSHSWDFSTKQSVGFLYSWAKNHHIFHPLEVILK